MQQQAHDDVRQAPREPAGPAPLRRPGSVRRTSAVDMTWPGGRGTQLRLDGKARDIRTPLDGGPFEVLAFDTMSVGVDGARTIEDIVVTPDRPGIEHLVGARGGGHLRKVLADVVPEERTAGTPLYLLLDDISGTSLIAGFAWSRWVTDWQAPVAGGPEVRRHMEGICSGFRPGSSALWDDGTARKPDNATPVPPLPNPEDPAGWHELDDLPPVSMRRARRIDVWQNGVIEIDAGFQDTAGEPDGSRVAVHEYGLRATADPATLTLLSVEADPRVLPFPECPTAVGNVSRLVGQPLRELRLEVLEVLKGTAGCTHLNDALRALAEVPRLVQALPTSD